MRTIKIAFLFIFCVILGRSTLAQFDPAKICRIEDDKLVFRLDQRWTDAERKEVSNLFDLDSVLLVKVFTGIPFIKIDGDTWEVHVLDKEIVEISKLQLPLPPESVPWNVDVMMVDFNKFILRQVSEEENVAFGINRLSNSEIFSYEKGNAKFYLPGFIKASKVFISGTFNDWSTIASPMQKTDTGWTITLNLGPGRYLYKYIIDGRWKEDPNNKEKVDDLNGGQNSVIFCDNHVFHLKGRMDARNVVVSGSFNNWNERELKLLRSMDGWTLAVYLREGTYAYKFIVDHEWMTDPANPITRKDASGNINSFIGIGDTLIFRLPGYSQAKQVALAGNFNNWDDGELMMEKDTAGWYLPYVIAKGLYEYKFIVDGKWMIDSQNPYTAGSGDTKNSVIAFQPNHVFELDSFPDAKEVIVTGSFTGWDHGKYRMIRKNGKWIFPAYLKPGKQTYKYIVDGVWMLDPKSELWEQNEYGTNNSLLWIE
jgi:hypothetical protein